MARAYALQVLVFAELLLSFGVRRIGADSAYLISAAANSAVAVAGPFGVSISSQRIVTLGRSLKTRAPPLGDCLLLVAIGALPMLVLNMLKSVRNVQRQLA